MLSRIFVTTEQRENTSEIRLKLRRLGLEHGSAYLPTRRDPEQRKLIYDNFMSELQAYDPMGYGPIDNSLWNLTEKSLLSQSIPFLMANER